MKHRKSVEILLALLLATSFSACRQERPSLNDYLGPPSPARLKDGRMIQLSSYDTTGGNNDRINIHAGETAEIANIPGPGIITRIWFTVDSRDPHFLRRILLRMYWDDETTPSVEVPLGDFFGSGFEYIHHTPHYAGMSSGGYYSYFPMPFNRNARIEVVNETGQEIFAFYYHINYYETGQPWDEGTGLFHAQWRRDIRTDYPGNYEVLRAKGRGQFVGLNFHGQPYNRSLFYLEGDEMIWVDQDTFPSTHGTGLEDYFTSGWYFRDGEFSADYHGLVLKDEETGRVTAYRHHIPDAIPFRDSIRVTLEHGHGNEQIADFSTTAFWYQKEPHAPFDPMAKAGLRVPLQRPVPNGSLEAEELKIDTELAYEVVDMTDEGSDWSGGRQLRVRNSGADGSFSLVIPDAVEAAYDAEIYYTSGPEGGRAEVFLQGRKTGEIDGNAPERTLKEPFRIRNLETSGGKLELEFRMTEPGMVTEIDAIHLTPVRNYIPEWYMIGPFDNPRTSDYERFGLDQVYPPEQEIDLDAVYEGADGQEVRWFRIEGAGYDMGLWNRFEPSEFIVVYALTYVYSPVEQTVPLYIGSDDGARVFLNDEQVYRFLEVRIAAPDQDRVELDLKPGWNKLLIKAENNFGGFAFYARIVDLNRNLRYSIDKN